MVELGNVGGELMAVEYTCLECGSQFRKTGHYCPVGEDLCREGRHYDWCHRCKKKIARVQKWNFQPISGMRDSEGGFSNHPRLK